MKKISLLLISFFIATSLFAQLKVVAEHDRNVYDPADELAPYNGDGGIRSVYVTDDLDGDGKVEIIATDYTNGGRVHVFEYAGEGVLELVWSSPVLFDVNTNSTPRWIQTGDLDADGNKEIIWPSGLRYEGEIQVWENVGDNDYGTATILDFPANIHEPQGLGLYRMDRERGTVYDFDGDGQSELIMANADNKVYILSINGNAPGFASWQIEGGDPNVHPANGFSAGSYWHSVPADIDGDDKIEIVNHYWNFYGFWSIDVNGPDDYTYPSAPNPDGGVFGPVYYEFMQTRDDDAVSFMGIAVVDVDGDGKDEIAGITNYSGPNRFGIALVSIGQGEDGVEVWDDSSKFSIISTRTDHGLSDESNFWSIYGFDLNENGRDEILAGGFFGENVVSVEYTGTGDILDPLNYTREVIYSGPPAKDEEWLSVTYRDSLGTMDTIYSTEMWLHPGVMKLSHGDVTGDGKLELVINYQANEYDSTEYTYENWDGSAWVEDSVVMRQMNTRINFRVLSYDPATGIYVNEILNIITPDDYTIEQNYPNPFNPSTTIRFSLPLDKEISLSVYDMLGKEVKTLIGSEKFRKGSYEVLWDGTNNFNQKVSSGNYVATLKYGNFTKSIKMTFLK
ncbi:FG-GAP-like repeat-containing protein [Bacteroidota bacterium]